MKICKYCNSTMTSEYETLSKNEYNFFHVCPNCKSVYEGKIKEKNKEKTILKSRWFNPKTNEFEEEVK